MRDLLLQNIDDQRHMLRAADVSLRLQSTAALVSFNTSQADDTSLPLHGVGANSATVAQAVEQVPSAVLHPKMTAGTAGAAMTVPNVKPAAA